MNTVITTKQAKEITGGRTPLVPVEYEEALKSLAACISLDEAKYWHDKADALAAWAKIYESDQAAVESKRLKLHAYRRMGEIATELRPHRAMFLKGKEDCKAGNFRGSEPGPAKLLREFGLGGHQTQIVRRLAKIPKKTFDSIINLPNPPTPRGAVRSLQAGSDTWKKIVWASTGLATFRSFCRMHSAKNAARGLSADEATKAKVMVREVQDWLDELEQYMPKEK